MATGDIWRFSCIGDMNAQSTAIVTLHFRFLSPGATPAGCAAFIKTNFLAPSVTSLNSLWNWRQINGLSVNLIPPTSIVYNTGFPLNGTAVGDPLPPQCAMVCTWRTAYAGRRYRGRAYLPGFSEANGSLGIWTPAFVTAWQGAMDTWLGLVGSGGTDPDYRQIVWSKTAGVGTDVTQAVVRPYVQTQRRRVIGVGM